MELIDGESLSDRLARAGALELDEVRALVTQLAAVLQHAHDEGIVHRDIKPANIMLLAGRDELFAKVVDFGIAKPLDAAEMTQVTHDGQILGTPLYMAPEQLFDGHPHDERADIWGLALVAYEALVGRRPFQGRTRASVGLAIAMQRWDQVSAVRPELPSALDEVLGRAFSLDSAARYANATELAEAFEAAASQTAGDAETGTRRRRTGLRIPDALYGRDQPLGTLAAAAERATAGRSQVVLIAGYSGVGKTALVTHAKRALVANGSRFASGKFDQFDRGTPYKSFVAALRTLVRRTLRRGRHHHGRVAVSRQRRARQRRRPRCST